MNNKLLYLLTIFIFFSCQNNNSVIDIDGNKYNAFKIDSYWWLAENLRVTRFSNGDSIPIITNDSLWSSIKGPGYCFYNNDSSNIIKYGILYNWYSVNDIRKICPCGWEVASKDDFDFLCSKLGGPSICGEYLKELSINKNNLTKISFKGLLGGGRDKYFYGLGKYGFFWNRNEYNGNACIYDNDCAFEHTISKELDYFLSSFSNKNRGMSIRCIKKDFKD